MFFRILLLLAAFESSVGKDINAAFVNWFQENGGILKNVYVHAFENMGNGFSATTQIREGEKIIHIPKKLIFSDKYMADSEDPEIANLYKATPADQRVVTWLLLEKHRTGSRFQPYFDILPQYVPSVDKFSSEELAELQHDALAYDIGKAQRELNDSFNKLTLSLENAWPSDVQMFDFDEFLWAHSIINSRGLRFNGQVYLTPMADIFNYAPHPMARTANSGAAFLKYHQLNEEDGSLSVYADRDVGAAGEQVFEDYGDNSDEVYLRYHGFVADENPFRCLSMQPMEEGDSPLAKFVRSNLQSDAKKELLRKLRFPATLPPQCIPASGKLQSYFAVYLTALSFTEEQVQHCMAGVEKGKKESKWAAIAQICGFDHVINAFANGVPAADEEEETPQLKLIKQMKHVFAGMLPAVLESDYHFDTTIEADEALLGSTQSGLNAACMGGLTAECKHLLHLSLAIKYRLAVKRMTKELRSRYGAECTMGAPAQASAKVVAAPAATEGEMPLEQKVAEFNAWFSSHAPSVSKIQAAVVPVYRIGTVATSDIALDELYLGVPVEIIMDSAAAAAEGASTAPLIKQLSEKYKRRDDFHELLFFLLKEVFETQEQSKYWPYLRLLPKKHDLDIPLFWTEQEIRDRLSPSLLVEPLLDYQESMRRKYDSLRKIDIVTSFFLESTFTYDNYVWATAILDSRSIWWSSKRHLVPMLDFINCREEIAYPKRVHSTALDRSGSYAETKSGGVFNAGEQLFENYGQANHIYFMHHGFVLYSDSDAGAAQEEGEEGAVAVKNLANTHDCVLFEVTLSEQEFNRLHEKSEGMKAFKKLGFSKTSSGGYKKDGICLTHPVSNQIYWPLAVKENIFDDLITADTVNTPHKEVRLQRALLRLIEEMLVKYQNIEKVTHFMSKQLLRSERSMLQYVRQSLQRDIARLSEDSRVDHDGDEL